MLHFYTGRESVGATLLISELTNVATPLYICAGLMLLGAFCFYFHLRFKIAVSVDILDLSGKVCVSFLRLNTICFDFKIEGEYISIYNKKGVPVYYPINLPETNPAEFKSRLYFPIYKKIRYRSICMTTEFGIAKNAALTAVGLSISRLVYDIVFSLIQNKNKSMKLCCNLMPVYNQNRIKINFTGIFIISAANIIIYGAVALLNAYRRKAAFKKQEKDNAAKNKGRIRA